MKEHWFCRRIKRCDEIASHGYFVMVDFLYPAPLKRQTDILSFFIACLKINKIFKTQGKRGKGERPVRQVNL
jgi:hypothetical protein